MGKILIIDRRPELTRFLRGQRRGGKACWDVLCAEGGQDGIPLAESEHELVLIVVSDQVHPSMTRNEVVKSLRALDLDVPIVLANCELIQAAPDVLAPFLG